MALTLGPNPVNFWPGVEGQLPYTTETYLQDLISQRIMYTAYNILSKEKALIGDVGTRDAGFTGFKLDPKLQLVYTDTKKEEVKVEGRREDNVGSFVTGVANKIVEDRFKEMARLILISSWGRDNPSKENQQIVNGLKEIAKRTLGTKVWILPQEWEARLSHISAMHINKFKNPKNPYLKGMTEFNTFQLEGGNGSIQSFKILLKQTQELAGKWALQQLIIGKTNEEIVISMETDLQSDLSAPDAMNGMEFVVLHGMFGIALSGDDKLKDREVPRLLGITEKQDEAWRTGQITKTISEIMAALETKIASCKTYANAVCDVAIKTPAVFNKLYGEDAKVDETADHQAALKKYILDCERDKIILPKEVQNYKNSLDLSVPPTLLLGMLKAGVKKYGKPFEALKAVNHKDEVPLFDENGISLNRSAKISPSQGAAVHFLIDCKGELSRFGEIFRECAFCGQ